MSNCTKRHPCKLCRKKDKIDLIARLVEVEKQYPGTVNKEKLSELLAQTTKT
jgi:hypothetical protein